MPNVRVSTEVYSCTVNYHMTKSNFCVRKKLGHNLIGLLIKFNHILTIVVLGNSIIAI